MIMLALFLLLGSILPLKANPMSCIALNQVLDKINGDYSVHANFDLNLIVQDDRTFINVSNPIIMNNNIPANSFCQYLGEDGNSICCNLPLNDNSCIFNNTKSSYFFELYAIFPKFHSPILEIFVDDSTFSYFEMFTPERSCVLHNGINTGNSTACCTQFETAPQAPKNLPKCKEFRSRVTIYNADDNHSIYMTSRMNITLEGNKLIPSDLQATLDTNYSAMYSIEDVDDSLGFMNSTGSITYNNIALPDGDSKSLIGAYFMYEMNYIALRVGRLLIRDNQTLMQEGKPFTSQDNCQYYSSYISKNRPTSQEFCCILFES